MKVVFFISFVFMVSCWGCRIQSVAPSLIIKDSIVYDSVITSDTVYWIDPLFMQSLFECDSIGIIHLANISNITAKFDSLKKISPIVRTVLKIKKEAIYITKNMPGETKIITIKKIHPLTYIISGISILVLILCGMLMFNHFRILKRHDT